MVSLFDMIKAYYNLINQEEDKSMSNFKIESKPAFTVAGIGTELTADYNDYAAMAAQKAAFWQQLTADGDLDALTAAAQNDYLFVANEAIDNKMMYYAGVETDQHVPAVTRQIQFPASDYLIVPGTGSDAHALAEALTGQAFGQTLGEASDFAYVGGPNAAVIMGERDGQLYGEMWIPVVHK